MEKNVIGVEKKENQFNVFKADIMDDDSAVAPVSATSSISAVGAVSGSHSSFDAIDVWRHMSEVYKNRRLAKEQEATQGEARTSPQTIQQPNKQNIDTGFQKSYEHDMLDFSSKKENSSWKTALMKSIHNAQLPVNDNLIEISKKEKYISPEDGILRVAEVMKRNVISVIETTKIEDVINVFNKYKISSVPVINYMNKQLVGIFTVSDILLHILDQKSVSSFQTQGTLFMQDSLAILSKPVSLYMNEKVIQVSMDCQVKEACKIMNDNNIKRLVVTENMHVVGIFSSEDAVKILADI